MGIFDRARESTNDDRHEEPREEPASETQQPEQRGGQVSQSGSSFDNVQSAAGGADAVPDTPDVVEEDYT
jgi:hypothetical protein